MFKSQYYNYLCCSNFIGIAKAFSYLLFFISYYLTTQIFSIKLYHIDYLYTFPYIYLIFNIIFLRISSAKGLFQLGTSIFGQSIFSCGNLYHFYLEFEIHIWRRYVKTRLLIIIWRITYFRERNMKKDLKRQDTSWKQVSTWFIYLFLWRFLHKYILIVFSLWGRSSIT